MPSATSSAWGPGCMTAARSPAPSTSSTRPPSWKRSTTAFMRCACALRCCGGTQSWTTGSSMCRAWTRCACSASCCNGANSCRTTLPLWPAAMSGVNSWPRRTSPASRPLAARSGSGTLTTAWACRRPRCCGFRPCRCAPCPPTSRCWPTGRSTSCPGAPASRRWRRATPPTAGASTWCCHRTRPTWANCTTCPSSGARSPPKTASRSTTTSCRPSSCSAVCRFRRTWRAYRRLPGPTTKSWTAPATRGA